MPTNIEFKAFCKDLQQAELRLLNQKPLFIGEDHQIDTYFNVAKGRLKLREGNIENALIYYERVDTAGIKQSNVLLYNHTPSKDLKHILTAVHGIKKVVDKRRKIYFIDNVKFHLDTVANLGTFIEVEAIDKDNTISLQQLQEQCNAYALLLGIANEDYISQSYSDLVADAIQ